MTNLVANPLLRTSSNHFPAKQRIVCLLITFCFFFGVFLCAPQPRGDQLTTAAFEGKLTLLRALSGPFHTLLADRYWLLSSTLNETHHSQRQEQINDPFFEAMQTVITLDSGYESAIRYGSTYLASILRQTDQAHQLIDTALDYSPTNSELYLLKISLEIGYNSAPRYVLINEWIAKFQEIEDEVPAWLGGSLLYAKQREIKRALQREDLLWLLDHATHEVEKAAIEQKLSELAD